MELPQLSATEIEAELKGTEYAAWEPAGFIAECVARAIRLARENEELRAKLQAQHQATWAMAIEAAAQECLSGHLPRYERQMCEAFADDIRNIPCPPLETKGE